MVNATRCLPLPTQWVSGETGRPQPIYPQVDCSVRLDDDGWDLIILSFSKCPATLSLDLKSVLFGPSAWPPTSKGIRRYPVKGEVCKAKQKATDGDS